MSIGWWIEVQFGESRWILTWIRGSKTSDPCATQLPITNTTGTDVFLLTWSGSISSNHKRVTTVPDHAFCWMKYRTAGWFKRNKRGFLDFLRIESSILSLLLALVYTNAVYTVFWFHAFSFFYWFLTSASDTYVSCGISSKNNAVCQRAICCLKDSLLTCISTQKFLG